MSRPGALNRICDKESLHWGASRDKILVKSAEKRSRLLKERKSKGDRGVHECRGRKNTTLKQFQPKSKRRDEGPLINYFKAVRKKEGRSLSKGDIRIRFACCYRVRSAAIRERHIAGGTLLEGQKKAPSISRTSKKKPTWGFQMDADCGKNRAASLCLRDN